LFLRPAELKEKDAPDYDWRVPKAQNQRIIKGETVLTTDDEKIAEMRSHSEELVSKLLLILKALGVS
jgi:hypothetical protein